MALNATSTECAEKPRKRTLQLSSQLRTSPLRRWNQESALGRTFSKVHEVGKDRGSRSATNVGVPPVISEIHLGSSPPPCRPGNTSCDRVRVPAQSLLGIVVGRGDIEVVDPTILRFCHHFTGKG